MVQNKKLRFPYTFLLFLILRDDLDFYFVVVPFRHFLSYWRIHIFFIV